MNKYAKIVGGFLLGLGFAAVATVETATYISDLNATYPAAGDLKSEGDDHIRLLKSTIKATFANITGAVTATHTELNYVAGVTSAIQTQLNAKAPSASPVLTGQTTNALGAVGAPSYSFTGDTDTGLWSPAANTLAWSVAGAEGARLDANGLGVGAAAGTYRGRFEFSGAALNGLIVNDTVAGGTPALVQVTKNGNSVLTVGSSSGASRLDLSSIAGQTGAVRIAGNGTVAGTTSFDLQQDVGANVDIVQRSNARMSFYTNATERVRIENDGRLFGLALHNNAGSVTGTTNQYIASGTYTPTVSATTNVGASTPQLGQWMRVGNVVTVSVRIQINPTATAPTTTTFDVSLPIASTLTINAAAGVITDASGSTTAQEVGGLVGNGGTNAVTATYAAKIAGNHTMVLHFTYLVA